MQNKFIIFLLLSLIPFGKLFSQELTDTVKVKRPHSAKKATYLSMALPGLGQAYNKKYWKIPVIYTGAGVIYYFAHTNNTEYRLTRRAYNYVVNGDTHQSDNPYLGKGYTASDLQELRDYYRRNMELSWIIMGLWYILNIVDAAVDAHLFDYDVSENLSLHLEPVIQTQGLQPGMLGYSPPQTGLKIAIKF